jgi:hypothetical protein
MAVILGWRYGLPYLRQLSYLIDQRRCANFESARDQVAFEQPIDPSRPPRIDYGIVPYFGRLTPSSSIGYLPPALRQFSIRPGTGLPAAVTPGVIFMHQRTTSAGRTRLVVLFLMPATQDLRSPYCVVARDWVAEPATWRPGSVARFRESSSFSLRLTEQDRLRVFMGQPDATDPSHFTIDYELNGERGTIDGWLRDGDAFAEPVGAAPRDTNVELHARTGPAVPRELE